MQVRGAPKLKVCCIGSPEEARLAIQYGASAIGLVSAMPSGPGVISDDVIAEIASEVPPGVTSVLLTSRQDADAIVEQQRRSRVQAIQICDTLATADYDRLRRALPGIGVIQVIHITGPEALNDACRVAPHVSALLLDSGNPALSVKELGGTGRVHDWTLSRRIREAVVAPVFLAGGLHSGNVRAAVQHVGPYAVDVCSGLRRDGALSERLLSDFVRQLWAA